ncbi:MAG: hypothetical protein J5I47_01865 [Vicingus serpentipes]|nr:hypothetical protein [Vicingus serpentipes]
MGKQIEIKICPNCNITFEGVKYLCNKCGNYNSKNNFKKWSEEDIQFLIKNYQVLTRSQIADQLGRSFSSVKSKAKQLNLKKTAAALSIISKRPNKGQFKKGDRPVNYRNVGDIVERTHQRSYQPTINGAVVSNVKQILLDNIKKVQENKDYIPQAAEINNNVKSIIDLAKAEIEMVKTIKNL